MDNSPAYMAPLGDNGPTRRTTACTSIGQSSHPTTNVLMASAPVIPFLKWAGGKRWLIENGFGVPQFPGTYYEPFLGAATLFFHLRPPRSVLSDINRDLVETFAILRANPAKVWEHLSTHAELHSDDYYYAMRSTLPQDPTEKAARFIYLNRTCWNGLYRVNRLGRFNVPRGTKNSVVLPSDNFLSISFALAKAELICCDFEAVMARASRGDFVFADPPYTVQHNANGFIKYNEKLFSWEDQIRLRDSALAAADRGAVVYVTNADHPSIIELYGSIAQIETRYRSSVISGQNKGRSRISELLIKFGG